MQRSFIKNPKEHKNIAFFWKESLPNPEENSHHLTGGKQKALAKKKKKQDKGQKLSQQIFKYLNIK